MTQVRSAPWGLDAEIERLRCERDHSRAEAELVRDQLRQANEVIAELQRAMDLAKRTLRAYLRANLNDCVVEILIDPRPPGNA